MLLTEQQLLILIATLPALVAMMLVYILTRHQHKKEVSALSLVIQESNRNIKVSDTEMALQLQSLELLQVQSDALQGQLEHWQQKHQQLMNELHRSQTDNEKLLLLSQKERQHTDEKLQQLEHNKIELKKDFEQLAQQILKSTQQEFSSNSQQGLELFLKPFRQQISDFKTKVEDIHTHELKQREALKTELTHLQTLNQQMTQEAHELSTALKGQKKTQGNWGELILENVLDRSGLRAGQDYKREVNFNTEEGKRRPDVIVYLPDEKHLIIDAKVSLNAYTRYINAETDNERSVAIKSHIQAISDRIRELSAKNYFELPGLKSPEMVFMFIPIEAAFVEAVKTDETLFQLAIQQQVLVATPTTLLTSLNIVRQLWRFEDQNKHSANLADQASKVYNQLRLFLESMTALGSQLDKSKQTYDQAMKQFMSGKGNLIKRVEDFQKLGVSVKKEMPAELIEKARLELDLIDHDDAQ